MTNHVWHPDLTVAAVCEHHGQFLLVEEIAKSTQTKVLNQPAGHIEEGESVIQAVIRETLEETQRHFTPEALLGLYRLEAENGKTYFRYTFIGSVSEIDQSYELDSDILDTHWMSFDEINRADNLRSPLVLSCIQDYLAGIKYPLTALREL
ncbi:MAG: NUDIX hydrolase [Gammaproteobacteria bacterium]|nr:NUDIX hydrolase [Gammaproteobacteria bacterium]